MLGIHVTMPAAVPPDIAKALSNSDPAPPGLSDAEQAAFEQVDGFYKTGAAMRHGPGELDACI